MLENGPRPCFNFTDEKKIVTWKKMSFWSPQLSRDGAEIQIQPVD
jgi:hypothetical protein